MLPLDGLLDLRYAIINRWPAKNTPHYQWNSGDFIEDALLRKKNGAVWLWWGLDHRTRTPFDEFVCMCRQIEEIAIDARDLSYDPMARGEPFDHLVRRVIDTVPGLRNPDVGIETHFILVKRVLIRCMEIQKNRERYWSIKMDIYRRPREPLNARAPGLKRRADDHPDTQRASKRARFEERESSSPCFKEGAFLVLQHEHEVDKHALGNIIFPMRDVRRDMRQPTTPGNLSMDRIRGLWLKDAVEEDPGYSQIRMRFSDAEQSPIRNDLQLTFSMSHQRIDKDYYFLFVDRAPKMQLGAFDDLLILQNETSGEYVKVEPQ